jgi:3',5'-cyclic AMP phosphodiesterase CpdA
VAALRHVHALADPPDFILFGGDYIMDGLKASKDDALADWQLWRDIVKRECRLPAWFALGNHDVWGWARADRAGLERDPHFGKGLALEMLGLKQSYCSFDRGGWHFIVLDSIQPATSPGSSYVGYLDDAQFAWLESDLRAVPVANPVCVVSHIPLLSVAVFLGGPAEKSGDWLVSSVVMHRDARRIKDLFHRHGNVRLCLSGHMHMVDDVTYLATRYCCNGAVCGNWWKGDFQEFAPEYAVLDLYADGSSRRTMISLA